MATHSSILAWRIPWTEEPGGLHTVHGIARVRHDLATKPPPPPLRSLRKGFPPKFKQGFPEVMVASA